MSSTSQVTTFSDLYTDLQNRVRESTGNSATQTIAKRFINIGLQDMHVGQGENFPWAERHAVLVTQPQYNTGTVSINQGSTTLTGSLTGWDSLNSFGRANIRPGGKLVIDSGLEVYEVASLETDASLTLTSMFTQASVTSVEYRYFEDEYALDADFLRPLDQQFFDENTTIDLIGRREFRMRYPRNNIAGKPMIGTLVDREFSGNTTPVRKVKFWKPPNEAYTIPYAFVTNKLAVQNDGTAATSLSNDDDEPIVPLQFRHAIVYHALQHYYRDLKDDQRSQAAGNAYTDLMLRVLSDQEIGSNRPQLRPRIGTYADSARSPYKRRRSHRYTTGTRFDEIR